MVNSVSILITKNPKLIQTYFSPEEKFLSKSVSFSNLLVDLKEDKKSLFYSTDRSKNIISLSHSSGEDTKNQGNVKGLIVVEIIDPDQKFEDDFVRFNLTEVFTNFIKPDTVNFNNQGLEEKYRSYLVDTVTSSNVLNQRFYIAYGNSDNLATWAGPFTVSFTDAQVKYSGEGQRKLVLYFAPVTTPFTTSYGVFGDDLPLTLYRANRYVSVSKTLSNIDAIDLDYSEVVYSLYEEYLTSIYAEQANIIVLLPEIKSFFLEQIRGEIKRCLVNTKSPVSRRIPFVTEDLRQKFIGLKLDSLAANKAAVANILLEFGLDVSVGNDSVRSDIKKLVAGVKEQRAEYLSEEAYSHSSTSYDITLRANLYENIWQEYYRPIKHLRDLLARFHHETVFGEETNVRVLEIWKNAGIIKDSSKPTVILGDINLVNQFLYGVFDEKFDFLPLTPNFPVGYISTPKATKINLINFEFLGNLEINRNDISDSEFTYDRGDLENQQKKKEIYGPKYYLRRSDLEKYFLNSNLSAKFKKLDKSFVHQYGELQRTGVLAIDQKINAIEKTGHKFPIFRFNVPNPNVLKLEMDSRNSYFAALFSTFQRLIYDFPTRFVDPIPLVNGNGTSERNIANQIIEIANKFIKTSNEDITFDTAKSLILPIIDSSKLSKEILEREAAKWTLFLTSLIVKRRNSKSPVIELSNWDGSELLGIKKIFSDLMRQVNIVRIRTLPMFQISKLSDLFGICYLISDTVDTYGFNEVIMSDVLSNEYRILEYKHIITREECYSEFVICLDPNAQLTKKSI